VLALLVGACSGAQSPAQPPRERTAREYFPMRANEAWSFQTSDADHPGEGPGLVVMRVVPDDGAGGFYVQTGSQGSTPPAVFEFVQGGVTRNGEVIINEPIRAGTRWTGRNGDSYVILHTGLTRTEPAGTYHDVIEVVRTSNDPGLGGTEYRETYWYAPDVGPIEGIVPLMLQANDLRRYHLVLQGYTPNGEF
jgi:hypothetical protein